MFVLLLESFNLKETLLMWISKMLSRRPPLVPWKIAKIGLFVCLYPCKIKKSSPYSQTTGQMLRTGGEQFCYTNSER